MPERAEFARLFQNRGVRRNRFVLGLPEVVADLDNQRRHMIEQTLRREHLGGVHWHEIDQPLEPARRQRPMLALHACADDVTKVRDDHGRRTAMSDEEMLTRALSISVDGRSSKLKDVLLLIGLYRDPSRRAPSDS